MAASKKKTSKRTGLSATMKKVAAEDAAKAAERAATAQEVVEPATSPTTPRAAKRGKKAAAGRPKAKAAAAANQGGGGGRRGSGGRKAKAGSNADAEAEAPPRKPSALDAAAEVLQGAAEPMSARDLVREMGERGLWSSPSGKTPDATLYSAIIREIGAKGSDSRFAKTGRGRFAFNGKRD